MLKITFFDLALIVPLFLIGGICSYTDMKYGKIFNKWIVRGLLWGTGFRIFLFLYNAFFLHQSSNYDYLGKITVNTVIAFLMGYLLWHLNFWSAGDAKFFTLCAFLLPLKFYSKSYLNYFPSFNLLLNLFIPLFFALTANALLVGLKDLYHYRDKVSEIKKISPEKSASFFKKSLKEAFQQFLVFVFISMLFQKLRFLKSALPGSDTLFNPLSSFLLFFVFSNFIFKLQNKKKKVAVFIPVAAVVYGIYLVFRGEVQLVKSVLRQALVFMVVINVVRRLLQLYINHREVRKIKVNELKKGSILSDRDLSLILRDLEQEKKDQHFNRVNPEGLTEKQAGIIRDKFGKNNAEIRIYKTFPFAPFMMLSVLVSILTQNSFIDIFLTKL